MRSRAPVQASLMRAMAQLQLSRDKGAKAKMRERFSEIGDGEEDEVGEEGEQLGGRGGRAEARRRGADADDDAADLEERRILEELEAAEVAERRLAAAAALASGTQPLSAAVADGDTGGTDAQRQPRAGRRLARQAPGGGRQRRQQRGRPGVGHRPGLEPSSAGDDEDA